jgi:hypothetical protein
MTDVGQWQEVGTSSRRQGRATAECRAVGWMEATKHLCCYAVYTNLEWRGFHEKKPSKEAAFYA